MADGEIHIGIVNSNVSDVNFGVKQAPIADDKYFIVGASDFDVEPIKSGFAPIEDYLNIPMSSSALTGYPTNGSLSGSDYEDCEEASSCHAGSTFVIDSIYGTTRLFYDFGGEIGIQEIMVTPGSPVIIENFDVEKMMIYAALGETEFGFTYSMIDNAGFVSPVAEYVIVSDVVLNMLPIDLTAHVEASDV